MKRTLLWVTLIFSSFEQVRGERDIPITRVFDVPPQFLDYAAGYVEAGDPFSNFRTRSHKRSAEEVLEEEYGIVFTEGTSASYQAEPSRLTVHQTPGQLYLVEQYLAAVRNKGSRLFRISFTELELNPGDLELAAAENAQWLLPLPADKVISRPTSEEIPNEFISFLQELSRPPVTQDHTLVPQGRGVVGVYSSDDIESKLQALSPALRSQLTSPLQFIVRPDQPGLIREEDRRYGVIANVATDDKTINLSVFLPEHGKALFDPGDALLTPYDVTFFDGHTLVLSAPREDGGNRVVMVNAVLIDPGGNLYNPGGVDAQ